jgi:hypothetical protein
MDNWFSSPYLYDKLCTKQTDTIGTLCQNRKGVPFEINKAKLKNGEHISISKTKLMIQTWKNKMAFGL